MKKLFVFILAVVLIFTTLGLFACGTDEEPPETPENPEKVTVTFIQEGQQDLTYTINKGETLINIPDPVKITGYDVVWDLGDFRNIQEDITVNAVKTAKAFTITFSCTLDEKKYSVKIPTKELSVKYNEDLTGKLPTDPTCSKYGEKYDFSCWVDKDGKTFNKNVFDIAEDITLYATFNIEFA